MKGLKTLTAYALAVLVLATFIAHSWSAPKGFQRRNWTPQAMLYLKGAQGRRFVSEDRKEGDVYDALHLETRSQDSSPLSLPEVAALLLSFIQQAKEEAIPDCTRELLEPTCPHTSPEFIGFYCYYCNMQTFCFCGQLTKMLNK